MTNVPLNPRRHRDTPRYVANSQRMELDGTYSSTIDYDFFDSESKGVSIQKSKLSQKKAVITEKVQTLVPDENVSKIIQRKTGDQEKELVRFSSIISDAAQDVKDCGSNNKETQTPELLEKKTIHRAVQTEKVRSPTRRKSVVQILAVQKTVNTTTSDKSTSCNLYSSHDEPAPVDAIIPKTRTKTHLSDAENLDMNSSARTHALAQSESDQTMTTDEHVRKRSTVKKDTDLSVTNDVTNCIAYLSEDDSAIKNVDVDLMSSDTTSDITTVTSRASSSEYSMKVSECSMSKQKNLTQDQEDNEPSIQVQVHPVVNGNLDAGEYRRLQANSSPSFKSSSTGRMPPVNMSFPRTKVLEIERDNRCLLRKINDSKNCPRKPSITAPNLNLSSAAINRRNKNMEIHWENQRFLRKLNAIKASTNSSSW